MNLNLQNKTVFVAGSSAGIGRAIARGFAGHGCRIMLCARSEKTLAETAANLRKEHPGEVRYLACDLSNGMEVDRIVHETLDLFGRVDILVTNSGGPPAGTFDSAGDEEWDRAFQNTLMHVVRLCRGFIPGMKERKWGRIVNITSVSVKQPVARLLLSNVFRPAVTGLAKTLSEELAPFNVTVNNVAPGYTLTARMEELFRDRAAASNRPEEELRAEILESTPMKRFAAPEEIAAAVLFLASEEASYITGTTLQVDGGYVKGLL